MVDLLAWSAKYIDYEEVELPKKGQEVKKEDPARSKRARSPEDRKRKERRRPKKLRPRFSTFTSLTKPPTKILEEIYNTNLLRFPLEKASPKDADI